MPARVSRATLVAEATVALETVSSDPARAAALATGVLEPAATAGDVTALVIAQRALGLVARDSGQLAEATKYFTSAIEAAERAGRRGLAGEVRMSYAPTLLFEGDIDGALAECDRAISLLKGLPRARAIAQRATIAMDVAPADDLLREYGKVLLVLRRHGDRLWEANVLHNCGLLQWQRRQFGAAARDFRRASERYDELGMSVRAAQATEHLGCVQAALGDVPGALRSFAEADHRVEGLALDDPLVTIDRATVLLRARLAEEALAAASVAVESLRASGNRLRLAEALLVQAEAALLTGDDALAEDAADGARAEFARRGRKGHAAMAALVAGRARRARGAPSDRDEAELRATARALWREGLVPAAMDASIVGGRLALERGAIAAARRDLAEAARRRRSGPALERVAGWHAEALRRLAAGDRRGARGALRAGLKVAEAHRSTLGATELRVRSAGYAAELAELGLRLAVQDGHPRDVLAWAERWRAGALRVAPVRPPSDRRLAGELAELRSVSAAVEEALLAGHDPTKLRRRQRALESSVQAHRRVAHGPHTADDAQPDIAGLLADLDGWVMIEFVDVDAILHALVVREGVAHLVALGDLAPIAAEVDAHGFARRRATVRRGSRASIAAADRGLTSSATRLDDLLLAPLARLLGDEPVVLVPTGALHGVAWPALPRLRNLPVTVSPSATLWHRSRHRAVPTRPPVLVAGPRLTGAAEEVDALARAYPEAVTFTPHEARCDVVARALDGAAFAHIAAHGTFRADNPMFSTLELADGSLTVYDLESLRRAPGMVVLSACESGRSSVHAGDELLGLAASLLAMGSRTLIASVVPVPDETTRPLMISFHARLRRGDGPAAALAGAQGEVRGAGDAAAIAGSDSFVCLGAG